MLEYRVLKTFHKETAKGRVAFLPTKRWHRLTGLVGNLRIGWVSHLVFRGYIELRNEERANGN